VALLRTQALVTVILVCLDGPVEIAAQVRVTGIARSNKSGTKPAAGWVRRITVNTWSQPRSWIDPDIPGPDMVAPVAFTQVADGYDFAGNLAIGKGPDIGAASAIAGVTSNAARATVTGNTAMPTAVILKNIGFME
jgi:hypothetical protein